MPVLLLHESGKPLSCRIDKIEKNIRYGSHWAYPSVVEPHSDSRYFLLGGSVLLYS